MCNCKRRLGSSITTFCKKRLFTKILVNGLNFSENTVTGEITDEFDASDDTVTAMQDGHVVVDGAMTIRDLNRAQDWNLPDDEANTLAGLVIHEAQMIPAEGQVFVFYDFRFEVVARKENRITRLKINRL